MKQGLLTLAVKCLAVVAASTVAAGCDKERAETVEKRLAAAETKSARVDDLASRLQIAEQANQRTEGLASRLASAERRIELLENSRKPDSSWVLWQQDESRGFKRNPVPLGAYPTHDSCISSAKARGAQPGANQASRELMAVELADHSETYSCLPPIVDPRFKH